MMKKLRYLFLAMLSMTFGMAVASEVTIDFNGMSVAVSSSNDGSGDINETWTYTQDGVTIAVSPKSESATNPNRFWGTNNGPQLRCYSGTITISANQNMSAIEFNATSNFSLSASTGTLNGKKWTGSATSVEFSVAKNTQINSIKVTLGAGQGGGDTPTPVETPTFDFTTSDYGMAHSVSGQESGNTYLPSGTTFTSGSVTGTITSKSGGTTTARLWETNTGVTDFRLYAGGKLTLSVPQGQVITKVVFEGSDVSVLEGPDGAQLDNGTWEGSLNAPSFTCGKVQKINYIYVTYGNGEEQPVEPSYATISTFPYDIVFTGGKGDFVIEDVELGGLSYVWSVDASYGMKASAYFQQTNHTTESWLVSPIFDLSSASSNITLSFGHALNKFSDMQSAETQATVWVREVGGQWSMLNGVTYPETQSWNFITSENNQISLASYRGKKIQIAFKYESDANSAGTWEISDFHVSSGTFVVTYQDMTMSEATAISIESGTTIPNINLQLNNALVVYSFQRESSSGVSHEGFFVREGDYAIEFYDTGLGLQPGQTITGSIKCKLAPYNNQPEVVKADDANDTNLSDVTLGRGTVAPYEMTADEAYESNTHLGDLVVVKNATIVVKENESNGETMYYVECPNTLLNGKNEDGSEYQYNATVRVQDYFGGFTFPTSVDGAYDVKAIYIATGKKARRLYVLSMTPSEGLPTAINTVEQEGNNAIYNLQGVRVEKAVKGVYIVNGKKVVVK